ncbi:MAG TPA: MBOAT family O-acyltransferase [Rhizomicrobium sp.]|nr:MBOAT family O-acyltransferase [Rhizomicrobium sp.]
MAVTSVEFLLFSLLICLALYLFGGAETAKKLLLIGASLFFYATYDIRFLLVLLFLTGLSYCVGNRVLHAAPERKRLWLGAGLLLGLLPLCFYKYLPIMVLGNGSESPVGLGGWLDELILPIGISFYTFQALSYPLDLYRGTLRKQASFLDFACFVTFFPKLLVGPITRAGQFLPQLESPIRIANGAEAANGVFLILQGLVKKLILADILAQQIVDPAFADPGSYGFLFLVLGVVAYSFQIYFDLSGYTDLVRGVSHCMGLELPINFNRPYLATSVSNFWQRWHISMSSFFRDYLYFSLGGSKAGNVYVNVMITFVCIGIWHGAGWNFVIYGFIHGSLVGWERFRRGQAKRRGIVAEPWSAPELVWRIFLTFMIVAWARVLFRADTLEESYAYLLALSNVSDLSLPMSDLGFAVLLLSCLLHFTPPRWAEGVRRRFVAFPSFVQAGIAGLSLLFLLSLPDVTAGFIYAQF